MGMMKPSKKAAAMQQWQADQQAAEIKQAEAARQENIVSGRANVDRVFNDKFSDQYYKDYGDAYTGYYNPQLDDKFKQTKQDLIYGLARQGILNSQAGVDKLSQADQELAQKKIQVASEATDATNNLRSNVEKQRSALYSLNESAADPSAVTNRATGEATALAAPVSFSPLGDVFSSLLNGLSSFTSGMASNVNSPLYSGNWSIGSIGKPSQTVRK
jgi:hypothetical protein